MRRRDAPAVRRRLVRTGPIGWLLGGYWVGVSALALAVALEAGTAPVPAAAAGVAGVALLVRMALMGVSSDGRELRCVSWLVTRRVPVGDVTAVRVVGYSGFANRFGDSGMLSMLVVERASARRVVLRGTVARAAVLKRVARDVEHAAWTAGAPGPGAVGVRSLQRETRAALAAVDAAFGSPADAPDADVDAAIDADSLQAAVSGGLTRSGMGTSGLLSGKELCRDLLGRTDLRPAQRRAVAGMLAVLERW